MVGQKEEKRKKMHKISVAMILIAGSIWGLTGIFVRNLSELGLGSMDIVEIKSIATALLIIMFLLIYDKKFLKIQLKDLWCFIGTGVISVLLFNVFYFHAITLMSLSVAVSLLYTSPVFVMIFSVILFKERITRRKVLAIISAFIGCILVSGAITKSITLTAAGFVFGLGSGVCFALYSIFSRFAINKGYHPFAITAYTFICSSIGGALFTDFALVGQTYLSHKSEMIINFFILAVVINFIPYFMYTLGLVYIENSKAAVMTSVEPAVATLFGFLIFSEIPSFSSLMGMILIVSAIVILNVQKLPKSLK